MKKILFSLAISATIFLTSCISNFTLFAGNGQNVVLSDFFAVNAKLNNPDSMTVDEKTGDLYVVAQNETIIKKITLDGKVSTFFDLNKSEIKKEFPDKIFYIGTIKIKDDYLYFSNKFSISRIKLNGKEKDERYIGSGRKNTLEQENNPSILDTRISGSFKEISFFWIKDFSFALDGNILISEHSNRTKLANIKYDSVYDLFLFYENNSYGNYARSGTSIKQNPISKELYFLENKGGLRGITNYPSIYKINDKNVISWLNYSNVGKVLNFDFDKEGNIYVISVSNASLMKIDLKGNVSDISNFWGVGYIGEQFPLFRSINSSPIYSESMEITIDRKRNILYLSVYEQNKIFKLNL